MASPASEPDRAERRASLAQRIESSLGPFDAAQLRALVSVPRERFVRPEDADRAELDMPLRLDDTGASTISAPHAYLLSFRLLRLQRSDRLLELGSGSGYGAALAADIVGEEGGVTTVEIDRTLAARATVLLRDRPNVRVLFGDAMDAAAWIPGHDKIVCTFAVGELPEPWLRAMEPNATLVAPVGRGLDQRLVRVVRTPGGERVVTEHGAVRYVANRSASADA